MESRIKVLVVEDEPAIASHVGDNLQSLGYAVPAFAACAEEAYLAASVTRPDVVLMDIDLKGSVDGIDAANRIYSDLQIPIVFLTAHADIATLRRAQDADAFGYMSKPVVRVDLMNSIETALQRSRKHDALRVKKAWLEAQLKSVGDGLIAASHDGVIWFINPEGERLLGVSAAEVVGLPFAAAVPLRNRRTGVSVEDLVRLTFLRGSTIDIGDDYVVDGASNRRIGGEVAISRFGGEPIGVVFTFRDTTVDRYRADALSAKLVNPGSQNCTRQLVNLCEVFTHTEQKLREKLSEGIKFSIAADPATYPISGNSALVEGLLVDLVEKAQEKLSGSGEIQISARNLDFERHQADGTTTRYVRMQAICQRSNLPLSQEAELERSDYGMRIDFSMAKLHSTLQALRATAHEDVGTGVTYWNIDIPVSDLQVEAEGGSSSAAMVVLIEPDASVRNALCESYLAAESINCLGARDSAEALEWVRMFPNQIDVVILPESSFSVEIKELCEESPTTRIMLISKNGEQSSRLLSDWGTPSAIVDHLCPQTVLRNALQQLLTNRVPQRTTINSKSLPS
jgi:PAS domain S-box-containing protein